MPPVKIAVANLRPGMFVLNTGASWLKTPYLYSQEGVITSEAQIAAILKQGYTEAYYDPEQTQTFEEKISFTVADTPDDRLEPRVALVEELPLAKKTYAACMEQVKHFMHDAQTGKVDVAASEPLVTNIIESLNRNADALTSLAKIRSHDEYTLEHSINVSIFSTAFGRYLGFDEKKLFLLGVSALFHDVGKMRIPLNILNAPRRLDDNEFKIMKTHAQLGQEVLEKVTGLPPEILGGVVQHHEKFDGSGYPHCISGLQISTFGRIISVADCYDALTAKRVYKPPLQMSRALAIMYGMRGENWETGLVEHFIKMLGIYPVGTPVSLSSGSLGVVARSNPHAPLTPTVLVTQAPDGHALSPPQALDLARQSGISITRPLGTEEASGMNIAALLGHITQNA